MQFAKHHFGGVNADDRVLRVHMADGNSFFYLAFLISQCMLISAAGVGWGSEKIGEWVILYNIGFLSQSNSSQVRLVCCGRKNEPTDDEQICKMCFVLQLSVN